MIDTIQRRSRYIARWTEGTSPELAQRGSKAQQIADAKEKPYDAKEGHGSLHRFSQGFYCSGLAYSEKGQS